MARAGGTNLTPDHNLQNQSSQSDHIDLLVYRILDNSIVLIFSKYLLSITSFFLNSALLKNSADISYMWHNIKKQNKNYNHFVSKTPT